MQRAADLLRTEIDRHSGGRTCDVFLLQEVLVDIGGMSCTRMRTARCTPVAMLHSFLALQVNNVVAGRRKFDVGLKFATGCLQMVNLHMPPNTGAQ